MSSYWEGWAQATWYRFSLNWFAHVEIDRGQVVARGLFMKRRWVFTPDVSRFTKRSMSVRLHHPDGDLLVVLWGRTADFADALVANGFSAR